MQNCSYTKEEHEDDAEDIGIGEASHAEDFEAMAGFWLLLRSNLFGFGFSQIEGEVCVMLVVGEAVAEFLIGFEDELLDGVFFG